MAKNFTFTVGRRGIGWGVFLLLIAALVLANQFGGFVELGFWSIVVSALAVAFLVQCLVDMSFGSIPIPLAALYFIFQGPLEEPLGLPQIDFWPLVLVTFLATLGLTALLPKKKWFRKRRKKYKSADFSSNIEEGVETIIEGVGEVVGSTVGRAVESAMDGNGSVFINGEEVSSDKIKVEESGDDNNPKISVQFGGISRYLHSTALETADLNCNFGSLEVYFDNVTLSPNGADVDVSCNFGSVELYVPKDWTVRDDLRASLGSAEVSGMKKQPGDGPELRINGSASFGSIDVNRI